MRLGSKWRQIWLWEGIRGKGKLTEKGNDKDTNKGWGIRGKNFADKVFMIREHFISFCSLMNLVNLVNI